MYAVTQGLFRTPRGRPVTLAYREDTNDADMARSCLDEDEYRLKELYLSGWALDIGAHIGQVTVGLLVDNPELTVAAIEPLPANMELLRRNTEPFGDRCWLADWAFGSGAKVKIGHNWSGNEIADRHHFVGNQYFDSSQPHDTLRVASHGLATLFKRFGGPPSLIVADCEGCEDALFADPLVAKVPLIRGELHTGPVVGPFEMRSGVMQ